MIRKRKCVICKYNYLVNDKGDAFKNPYKKETNICQVCIKTAKRYEEIGSRLVDIKKHYDMEQKRLTREYDELCEIENIKFYE